MRGPSACCVRPYRGKLSATCWAIVRRKSTDSLFETGNGGLARDCPGDSGTGGALMKTWPDAGWQRHRPLSRANCGCATRQAGSIIGRSFSSFQEVVVRHQAHGLASEPGRSSSLVARARDALGGCDNAAAPCPHRQSLPRLPGQRKDRSPVIPLLICAPNIA